MQAIIMAGGLGTRLRPYTDAIPKPLVPLNGEPMLDIVLCQLSEQGFERVTITVFHLAEAIIDHVGDGSRYGLDIDFSLTTESLGTAGPLAFVERPAAPCLVLNADLLTNVAFGELMAMHRARQGVVATMVLTHYGVKIPYGTVEIGGDQLAVRCQEKPTLGMLVNTGIYVIEPASWDKLVPGEYADMPDLISRGLRRGRRIATFLHNGEWLDIGTPEQYAEADQLFTRHRGRFVGRRPAHRELV